MVPEEIKRAIDELPADAERELREWLTGREKVRRRAERAQKKAARPALRPTTLREAVTWSIFALVCFFAVEGAIFHSGLYSRYMEPNSSAGFLEGHMTWLAHTPVSRQPEIFVIGDSRIAEGFSARAAVQATSGGYTFWNLGVPGASPRVWFYMLRDLVRTHPEPAAVVLGLDRFSDADGLVPPQSSIRDLNYLAGRLRLTDCVDIANSMESSALWMQAAGGCVFRGLLLIHDLHDLLTHWSKRLQDARDFRVNGHGYIDGYGGKAETLTGLRVDFAKREIYFPPETKEGQKDSVRATVLPAEAPQTGAVYRYRKLWLGRILRLFKGKTRIIFIELPRAPLPIPDATQPPGFLSEAFRTPRAAALPRDTFHDLERPETFADGLHLNTQGRAVFSQRLGEKVIQLLATR